MTKFCKTLKEEPIVEKPSWETYVLSIGTSFFQVETKDSALNSISDIFNER